jgi:hypothetical protein
MTIERGCENNALYLQYSLYCFLMFSGTGESCRAGIVNLIQFRSGKEMNMRVLLRLAFIVLCLFNSVAFAQKDERGENVSPPSGKTPKSLKTKAKEKAEITPRQQQVLWLLENLEERAKKLDSSILKVKVLAKVAESLWPYDESRARRLFTEAFHAIDSIKLDASKDQRLRIAAASGGLGPLSDLRAEVLQLMAARDFKLAERLQKAIKEAPAEGDGKESPQAELSEKEELAWDIAVASVKTQPERTAQFVRQQLRKGLSEAMGWALVSIRRENPQLAEQLYHEALTVARSRLTAMDDFETLAIYVLPTEDEVFYGRSPDSKSTGSAATRDFLGYASARLMAQSASGHAMIPRGAQAHEEYRTWQGLLPLFENLAPEKVSLVRERMTILAAAMSPQQANATPPQQEDVSELLRQAEATIGDRKRDVRLIQVSMIALRQGDLAQAISIAEKISDLEERSIQVSLLSYQASLQALEKGEFAEADRLARKIEFLPQRVVAFTTMANKLRANKEMERARAVLEEIWEWTNKAANNPQKAKALLTLTAIMSNYDSVRAFDFLQSAVKTISSTNFSPPEANKKPSRVAQVTLDMLDFPSVFSTLARVDFDRTMQAAQSLTPEEASLLAQAILCQQALASDRRLQTPKSSHN